MPDAPDVYTDQFQLHFGPYGCLLNFLVSSTQAPPPGTAPQAERVASVRMSLEHLKVMTYILYRQTLEYETSDRDTDSVSSRRA
ncbi:MAG: hypothetical protein ACRDFW_10070 [bacterium]